MKLTVIEYGGEPRQIECESFEFRCNHVTNWIRIMHADGSEEMVHDVCVIKTDKNDPKTGHWITKIKSDLRGDMWPTNPKCSECGEEPYYSNTIYNYKFCPYCGAKMVEPQEGEG